MPKNFFSPPTYDNVSPEATRIRLCCYSREHADDGVKDDLSFVEVRRRDVNEDVLGVERDLGMIAVDDRRHRQHHAVLIPDHRIPWLIPDNPEVMPEVAVGRVELHQLHGGEIPRLVQRPEANFRRDFGIVDERGFDCVEVVRADGHERSLSTDVVM